MGFDQYHEPAGELPPTTRTFARLCASLTEEAEAIGWYEQRIAVETDAEAVAVMRDAQGEEFKHFSMDLEFLLRRTPDWREVAQGILFQSGERRRRNSRFVAKCLNSSPWASRMIARASRSVSTAMRCSYQPIASASSVREAHRRANVRVSAGSSSGGSWY